MPITQGGFLAQMRYLLTSTTHFPDAQIRQWLNDAIADYSNTFPRRLTAAVAAVTGQREYSLSALTGTVHSILQVEYPTGEDPPRYLVHRPETSPMGFINLPVYTTQPDRATLIIGESPTTGENITLTYHADHDYPDAEEDTLTVPDKHIEALTLFVQWKAIEKLHNNHAADPQRTTLLLSMFSIDVYRAERLYKNRMTEYEKQTPATPTTIEWDISDRWATGSSSRRGATSGGFV